MAVQIAPMFWQTWWFRLAAVLVLVSFVAAYYRFRMRSMARQLNVRFEERLAERTRIAQELHDTLLQGFLSASMQLHVAADQMPADSPARPLMSRGLQLMGQVIEEGRNAVRGLRSPDRGSLDLAQAFSQIQGELDDQSQADFRVVVEGQPQTLHPVIRDEVYRIGREALVNAFRHSRATKIEVDVEYSAKRFRILIRDNGCGIDPSVLQSGREGHWGLPGMRERAERIGGQLHVWSKINAGTEVVLSAPSHVAFQEAQKNRSRRGLAGWFARGSQPAAARTNRGGDS